MYEILRMRYLRDPCVLRLTGVIGVELSNDAKPSQIPHRPERSVIIKQQI